MARVHFGTFFECTGRAYKGNDKVSKKILYAQLSAAGLINLSSFPDFFAKVKLHAEKSAAAEGKSFKWRRGDENLDESLASGNGDARKASAIHFYLLSHDEYAGWARALNGALDLHKLLGIDLKGAVFGFGFPAALDKIKRVHPIPPRPSGPFHWPLYVSEDDARSANLDAEGVWLNPLNHYSIPLAHRQNEIALLDAFVRDERPFLICALVAPSGAGKTRLVSEWMRQFVPDVSDTDWDAGFVTDRKSELWATWDIKRSTVIVIDYTYAYDEVMKAIVERCRYHRDEKAHKVRLLVIDHIYPQILQNDFFWGRTFTDQAYVDGRKSKILFDQSPIKLKAENVGSTLLREVIAATASSQARKFSPNDQEIVKAEAMLSEMGQGDNKSTSEAVRHPLFAALLGQALREGRQDFMGWSRRDLIMHYFAKPSRLPWLLDQNDGERSGIWVGAYVAAATLFRGMPFEIIRPHLPASARRVRGRVSTVKLIEMIANRIVSSSDRRILKALEPDILGENFLIHFFEVIYGDDEAVTLFANMLIACAGSAEDDSALLNFLETMQRLARNLLNDDPRIESVSEAWNILDNFLTPNCFPKESSVRQSISIVRSDIVKQCKIAGKTCKAAKFVRKIDADDLKTASTSSLWFQAAIAFVHYFEQNTTFVCNPDDLRTLSIIAQNFTARSKRKWPALLLPIIEGYLDTSIAMLHELKEDINSSGKQGWTPVMVAAERGHGKIVDWLISLGADVNLSRDKDGYTALMLACGRGHTEIVALLLKHGAAVDQGMTDHGWTALMAACTEGRTESAALLLKHGAAVDRGRADDGTTALMAACARGHTKTVALLLKHGATVDQGRTNDGITALMTACARGDTELAALLVEEGASVTARTIDDGWSPLMLAAGNGHLETVKCLLRTYADTQLTATTNHGFSALMVSCGMGQFEVTKFLLESFVFDLSQTDNQGGTALDHAHMGGNEAIVLLMREAC